jgi:hypothetical protein
MSSPLKSLGRRQELSLDHSITKLKAMIRKAFLFRKRFDLPISPTEERWREELKRRITS